MLNYHARMAQTEMYCIQDTHLSPIKKVRWKNIESDQGESSVKSGGFQRKGIARWNKNLVAFPHCWDRVDS